MYRFLLIEDAETDIQSCISTVDRMNEENPEINIELGVASEMDQALHELKNDYNGAIIDIKLNNGDSGNDVIKKIVNEYRIPVAVMTGTPDTILDENSPIVVYKKGESTYEDILNSLMNSFKTGLFDVMGGKGILESTMNKVFWNNLYPQICVWEELKGKGYETEKILLRYAISHIQELIDLEVPAYITQEMYIKPPISEHIQTGSIIRNKLDNLFYVVLSPPCDLAIHNGKIKTDRVMACEIEEQAKINLDAVGTAVKKDKQKNALLKAIKNNHTEYYHWLPENNLFVGGYINFRNVYTFTPEEIEAEFEKSELHIQDYFVKDILSRFSAYYARQGQPDFEFDEEAEKVLQKYLNNMNI